MKTEQLPTGQLKLTPETPLDYQALWHLNEHLPLFAGCELNIINAFKAGYAACEKDFLDKAENS